jgi:hypothetical protein
VNKGNFIEAYCLYDEALNTFKDKSDQATFLLNKAIMCSKLNLKKEYA